jgi:hypothetical protein
MVWPASGHILLSIGFYYETAQAEFRVYGPSSKYARFPGLASAKPETLL